MVPTPKFVPSKTKVEFEERLSAVVVKRMVLVPPKVVSPVPP